MPTKKDDDELIGRIALGDVVSFETLYNKYSGSLYQLVYTYTKDRFISEDILQNIFTSLWEKRGSLEEIRVIKAYLFSMAKFAIINHHKAEQSQSKVLEIVRHNHESAVPSVEEEIFAAEYVARAKAVIASFPSVRREIFLLSRESHLTYDEIAEKLNLSKTFVKKQIVLALKDLREFLAKDSELTFLLLFICQNQFQY